MYMYVCMTYTHTHTNTYINKYIHTLYVCIYLCMGVYKSYDYMTMERSEAYLHLLRLHMLRYSRLHLQTCLHRKRIVSCVNSRFMKESEPYEERMIYHRNYMR